MAVTEQTKKNLDTFRKANNVVQAGNSGLDIADGMVEQWGSDADKERNKYASGSGKIVAGAAGTAAAGADLYENTQNLKDLKTQIDALKLIEHRTPEQERKLKNLKGKQAELRIANVKGLSDATGGVAQIAGGAFKLKGDEKSGNISGIIGGGAGAFSGGLSMWQAMKKKNRRMEKIDNDTSLSDEERKTKKARIKSKYRKEMGSGALGMLGGLLGAGSGIAGLLGAKGWSNGLGMVGGLAGMSGSLLDLIGGGKRQPAGNQTGQTAGNQTGQTTGNQTGQATGTQQGQTSQSSVAP